MFSTGYKLCTRIEIKYTGNPAYLPTSKVLGQYVYEGKKWLGAPMYALDNKYTERLLADFTYNGLGWQGRVGMNYIYAINQLIDI